MNILTLAFIIVSVSLSVAAQILLKRGMSSEPIQQAMTATVTDLIWSIASNIYVILGLGAYVSSAAIWLMVLAKVDVSKAYPFVGLGFIGTMLFAYWFLNEPLTLNKIVGTAFIFFGVVLISK